MIDPVHIVGTCLPRWVAPFYSDVLWRVPVPGNVAYLTFDDGPTLAMTSPLLDLLAEFDATGTFFLLGRHAEQDPGLVRAIADGGHTIGNHTYSHPDPWKTTNTVLLDELNRTTHLLEDLVQYPIRWMRPPYGHMTRVMRHWCTARRQRCTMWDVGPADFLRSTRQEQIERRILRAIRPGSIIVLHDNPTASHVTPAALRSVLTSLRDEGWRFVHL